MERECNYVLSLLYAVAYLVLAGIDAIRIRPGEYLYRDIGKWRCRKAGATAFWMWGCHKGPLGKTYVGRKRKPVYIGIKDVYIDGNPTTR